MCNVELVKNTDTGHSRHADAECERRPEIHPPATLPPHLRTDDRLGEEDQPEKQEACREQPVDALRPGCHCSLPQVLDDPRDDHRREQQPDRDDEQWRLDQPVVEPLAGGMEQRDAIRLCDRPHDAAEHRERPQRLNRDHARRAPSDALLQLADVLGIHPPTLDGSLHRSVRATQPGLLTDRAHGPPAAAARARSAWETTARHARDRRARPQPPPRSSLRATPPGSPGR